MCTPDHNKQPHKNAPPRFTLTDSTLAGSASTLCSLVLSSCQSTSHITLRCNSRTLPLLPALLSSPCFFPLSSAVNISQNVPLQVARFTGSETPIEIVVLTLLLHSRAASQHLLQRCAAIHALHRLNSDKHYPQHFATLCSLISSQHILQRSAAIRVHFVTFAITGKFSQRSALWKPSALPLVYTTL
jgi:hypothetical protein